MKESRRRFRWFIQDVFAWSKYVVVVGALFAIAALLLTYAGTGYLPIGSGGTRQQEERERMLASGDCAIRRDGSVAGKIVNVLSPSRGMPRTRYQLADVDKREIFLVDASEVQIVPCAELATD